MCKSSSLTPRAFLAVMLAVSVSISGSATTCIALKQFKVRRVCGQIQTVQGNVIPDAMVQVRMKGKLNTAVRVQSDDAGNFKFGRLDEGEYQIQVDVRGFHSASQEFEIRHPEKETHQCGHPLVVLMQVADGCSSVAKAGRKYLKN